MWPICRRCIFILYYLIICYFYIIVDNNIYVRDDRHCPWIVCYDSDLCSIYLQMYRRVRWIMNDDELGCATEFTWSFTKSLIAISSWFVSKIIDSDCFLREKCTRTQSPISWCLIHSCKVWWSFSRVSVTDTNNIFILINWSACSHVLFFWGGGRTVHHRTIILQLRHHPVIRVSSTPPVKRSDGNVLLPIKKLLMSPPLRIKLDHTSLPDVTWPSSPSSNENCWTHLRSHLRRMVSRWHWALDHGAVDGLRVFHTPRLPLSRDPISRANVDLLHPLPHDQTYMLKR